MNYNYYSAVKLQAFFHYVIDSANCQQINVSEATSKALLLHPQKIDTLRCLVIAGQYTRIRTILMKQSSSTLLTTSSKQPHHVKFHQYQANWLGKSISEMTYSVSS